MQRRAFLGSLFGGVAAAPLGAHSEQLDRMDRKQGQNELLQLKEALRTLLVENERLYREIGKKNQLVHEINCRACLIQTGAELTLDDPRAEISHDMRFDLKLIASNGEQISRLTREYY